MTAFIDARSAEIGDTIDAPIAIIGAGAAGLTLALEFAAKKQHVLLVESGGALIEGQTQALYLGSQTGVPYFDLTSCRLRYFGGTTNHWSGFCRANDPIDYEARPALGMKAWPVGHDELEPFIARAARILEIREDFFAPRDQLTVGKVPDIRLVEDGSTALVTKNFQLSQNIRFGTRFRDQVARSPYIHPVEHLNVVEIVLDESGRRVAHLKARTLDGKQVRIDARRFVLCCHAIENARLLLASDARMPGGIGNGSDHVGRYFMEHAHLFASRFYPSARFPALYGRQFLNPFHLNANISLSDAAMREHGTLSYYCRFNEVGLDNSVLHARARLRRRFWEPASSGLFQDIATLLTDPLGAIMPSAVGARHFALEHRIDQAPNPDSRITLTGKKDRLGMRMINLHWDFTDLDLKTLNTGQEIVARELSALGWGRFEIEEITKDLLRERVVGNWHHIGLTRMSDRPEDGVVDRNLRVHGVDNLWVGGSGVFPSAGYSGPTMMLIGMSIRLADHMAAAA